MNPISHHQTLLALPATTMLYPEVRTPADIQDLLRPETAMERRFLADPEFQQGLMYGKPRFGHPEGKIVYHIREVLDNVDRLGVTDERRRELRIITFVHDTFKHCEHKGRPRDWKRHHAVLARKFLEKFTPEKRLLKVTELHDEAYYAWRAVHLYDRPDLGQERLVKLVHQLDDALQLFYEFFVCDTRTGDKVQAPVKWFAQAVPGLEPVVL